MGLPPLEYFDCFLDSPTFREIIQLYEKELESNSTYVKQLVKECRHMISATEEFSKSQQSFAQVLGNFKFQTIGDQTEDEKMISSSLQTFAKLLFSIEDCRHNMLSTISVRLLQTLERFRKEQIQKAKDEKKKFDRASERYYQALEKHLSISSKKKEFTLNEADSSLQREHAGFRQSAFDYVCKLQDVHAQKQYELIEPIIGYISDVSTFLHQAYDNAGSVKPELQAVQFKVQILRETHLNEQEKAYELKAQVIEEGEAGLVHHPEYLRQGILFVQDTKQPFGMGQNWHRYFCQFRKHEYGKSKSRQLRLIPIGHNHGLAFMHSSDFMEVKDCIRSRSEDVERRFCFEVEFMSTKGETRTITMQALSNEERKGWLEIMEGKEPVYTSLRVIEVGELTPQGYVFIKKCIEAIESRGLDEEGLYRKPGVLSKATKLMKEAIEKGKVDTLDLSDEFELDTKTVASAIKGYFSKQLGEPLLTYQLHEAFIEAAKILDYDKRVETVRDLVGQLPDPRRKILLLLMEHLGRVAAHSDQNLMKASNIGVVFGPTLMRPERESVAAIVDIKYQNIIVELMIVERERIFSMKLGSTSASPSISENKKKPETGRLQKTETVRLREPPEPPVSAMNELAMKRASIMADRRSASSPVYANSGTPVGPPPTHEPPPRPIPPLPGNPNIPPPPITRQKPSKSPEPYEQPLITRLSSDTLGGSGGGTGGGAGGGDRKRLTGPPPVPKNKPQIGEVALKRRPQPEPLAGTKALHPAAIRTESAPVVPPALPLYQNESAAFPFARGASKFREREKERERDQESEEKEREKREREASPPRPWRNQKPPGKKARALYDCDAEDSLELSFKKDEILYHVLESEEPSWMKAHRADGRTGLVPANYIEMLP